MNRRLAVLGIGHRAEKTHPCPRNPTPCRGGMSLNPFYIIERSAPPHRIRYILYKIYLELTLHNPVFLKL